jgi:hypothetical protein
MKCFKQMFGFGGSGLTAMLLALGIGTATPAKVCVHDPLRAREFAGSVAVA